MSSSAGAAPALSVRGLVKQYKVRTATPDAVGEAMVARVKSLRRRSTAGTFRALDGIDLDVEVGEVLGIVGHNGAGKSTLLKILSRVTEPSAGRIEIRGQVGALLEVGTGFHPELTGRENIFLNGSILGMSRAEINQRFDDIVDFSGVEKFLEVPVKRYSSGMSVRLAFAVASSLTPDVLIVDEVLAVGDAEFQKKCMGRMQDVAATGRTVLFVSHNIVAVQALCTRAVLLKSGRLVADGTPGYIANEYISGLSPSGIMSSPGNIDISRGPTGERRPHLRSVSMFGSDGRQADVTSTGGRWTVDVTLEDAHLLTSPVMNLSIWSEAETVIASIDTLMTPAVVEGVIGSHRTYRLVVDPVPLLPGRYSVNVGVRNGGESGYLDLAERIAVVTVLPGDVYGSGVLPAASDGVIYLPARWSVS